MIIIIISIFCDLAILRLVSLTRLFHVIIILWLIYNLVHVVFWLLFGLNSILDLIAW